MRLITFLKEAHNGERSPRLGALLGDGEHLLDFRAALKAVEGGTRQAPPDLLTWLNLEEPWLNRARQLFDKVNTQVHDFEALREKGTVVRRDEVEILAPVPRPGKLICIGLNYRDHAIESNMPIPTSPVIFSKFVTSVTGPNQPVFLPPGSEKVDYEAELAVVIGRRARRVKRDDAYQYVLGYTNLNDVSARDFQFADGQWQRGKSCDSFAPMGEYIVTTDEVPDPHNLAIKLRLNGQTMQDSSTKQLIFGIPELIEFLSQSITLEPGDVIATGTPPGVGFARKPPVFLQPGDVMEVEIEGLGILSNTIERAAD